MQGICFFKMMPGLFWRDSCGAVQGLCFLFFTAELNMFFFFFWTSKPRFGFLCPGPLMILFSKLLCTSSPAALCSLEAHRSASDIISTYPGHFAFIVAHDLLEMQCGDILNIYIYIFRFQHISHSFIDSCLFWTENGDASASGPARGRTLLTSPDLTCSTTPQMCR